MFSSLTVCDKRLESMSNVVYYPALVVAQRNFVTQAFMIPNPKESLDLEHLLFYQ
jgi:hypothetical protein